MPEDKDKFEPLRDTAFYGALANEMYRAYSAVTGGKNFQGDPLGQAHSAQHLGCSPVPEFNDLPPRIQSAWEAAARQVYEDKDPERFKGWMSPRFR